MPRVTFVKCAQKDVPNSDIKKGESYYWWKFRFGGKRVSRTQPKRSQLTQSSFYATLYDIEDDVIAHACADASLPDTRDDVVSQLEDLKSECESSLDNIPDSLKEAPTGEMLQERIDALQSAIDEFEGLDLDEWEATQGSEVLDEQKNEDGACKVCGKEEHHTTECEENNSDEATNDEGLTEQEYWDGKLEEFTGISIDAP